jgi:excisionase family DNA binding protein
MHEETTYLTTGEIAARLRVSSRTVVNWVDTGLLVGYRFGGTLRVERDELDAFIERSKVSAS